VSSFSPCHFHRIVSAFLGEPPGGFIARPRIAPAGRRWVRMTKLSCSRTNAQNSALVIGLFRLLRSLLPLELLEQVEHVRAVFERIVEREDELRRVAQLQPAAELAPQPAARGLQAAQRVGAGTCLMDWIQLGPWTSPDEKGFGVCPKFVEASVGYGLMIDPKTGKRFINETGNRKVRADAILAIGHPAIILISETNIKKHVPMSTVKAGLDNGSIKRFASLEELAQNYGIDPKLLKESVDRWNDAIAKKTDPDFKAKIFDDTEANEGSFFACRLWPRVHYCMGGLTINAKAEVIDTDFNILPGLFAAGEVCGGVHGMVRLGTVSIADCIVYGRVAGKAAANRKA